MSRVFIWIIGVLVGVQVAGCDIINPEESVPFYLKIESPTVRIIPGQNTLKPANIKDLWIDHNENFVGVYPIPIVIPIFPDDQPDYTFTGGVFNGGLSAFRTPYPFWKATEIDINVALGDTFVYQPVFEYFKVDSILTFALNEQFEGSSLSFKDNIGTPDAVQLVRTTQDAFVGAAAGIASFTSTQQELEALSVQGFPLPQRGNNNIFIEITYKNDIPFTAGFIYSGSSFGTISNGIFFSPKSDWNTIYIDFNSEVRAVPVGSVDFRMFIRASGQGSIGDIYFDNIRVVHFK